MAVVIDAPDARYSDPIQGTAKIVQIGDGVLERELLVCDKINVRPNYPYTASVDLKADEDYPGESHFLTLRVYNEAGVLVKEMTTEDGKIFIEPEDLSTSVWTRFAATFRIPENAYKASVVLGCQGAGILYADGVQLQRGEIDTAFNPHTSEELSIDDLNLITNPDQTPPGKPTVLVATGGFRNIVLTWNAPGDFDIAEYDIFRSATNDRDAAELVGSTGSTVFSDSGLTTGVAYFYWVRARDTSGNVGDFNAGVNSGVTAQTLPLEAADFQALSIVSAMIADATIDDAKIANLSAAKLTAGTISSPDIRLGSDRFTLDGVQSQLRVRDEAGTTRVLLGRLGAGSQNFGLQVRDQTGKLILGADGLGVQIVGVNQLQDGAVVSRHLTADLINAEHIAANSVTAEKIVVGAINTSHLAAKSVTADKLTVGELSAITADLGTVQAGRIEADGVLGLVNYWDLNTGRFQVSTADGLQYIRMDPARQILEIKGSVDFQARWDNLIGRPQSLSAINSDEATKLAGIAPGADVTANNVARDVTYVGGQNSTNIATWARDPAARINSGQTTRINGGFIQTGTIEADKIDINELSALTSNIGVMTAGLLRSQNNVRNYLNLNASGTGKFLNVNDKFWVTANGDFEAQSGVLRGDLFVDGSIQSSKLKINTISKMATGGQVVVTSEQLGKAVLILPNSVSGAVNNAAWMGGSQIQSGRLGLFYFPPNFTSFPDSRNNADVNIVASGALNTTNPTLITSLAVSVFRNIDGAGGSSEAKTQSGGMLMNLVTLGRQQYGLYLYVEHETSGNSRRMTLSRLTRSAVWLFMER